MKLLYSLLFCCQIVLLHSVCDSIIAGSLRDGFILEDSLANARNRTFNAISGCYTLIEPDVAITVQHTLPSLKQSIIFTDRISGQVIDTVKVKAVIGHKDGDAAEHDIGLVFFERAVRGITPIPIVRKSNLELMAQEVMAVSFGPIVRACYRVEGATPIKIENPGGRAHTFKNQIGTVTDETLTVILRDGDRINPHFVSKVPLREEGIPIGGDSGSPLFYYNDERWELVGVMSGIQNGYYGDLGNWVSVRGHSLWIARAIQLHRILESNRWQRSNFLDIEYKGIGNFMVSNSEITIPLKASIQYTNDKGDNVLFNSTLNLFGEFIPMTEYKILHLHGATIRGNGKIVGNLSSTWNAGRVCPGYGDVFGTIEVTESFIQNSTNGCCTVIKVGESGKNDKIKAKEAKFVGGTMSILFDEKLEYDEECSWVIVETTEGIVSEIESINYENIPVGYSPVVAIEGLNLKLSLIRN